MVDNTLFYQFKARLYGIGLRPIDSRGNPRSYSDGTYGFRYGGEFQMNWNPSSQYYLTTGISVDANTTHSSFFQSADGDLIGSQPEGAVFMQWEQNLTSRLSLTAGLRYDYYSIDASDTVTKLSPKVNLAYALTPNLAAQGILRRRIPHSKPGRALYRGPRLLPDHSQPGPDPRRKHQLRGGAEKLVFTFNNNASSLLFDVAFFWNEFDHLIETAFVPSRSAFQFVNLTSARIRGLESSIESSFFDESIRLRVGYTYLDAEDLETNQPLSFRAEHQISSSIDATLWQRILAGVDFRYLSRPESVNSDFALFVPDAETLIDTQVLDARIGYQASNWKATFILRNALEYYYMERPALLAPPRHGILQLEARF